MAQVDVEEEKFDQRLSVREALEYRVHETGVAQVLKACAALIPTLHQ